MLKRVLIVGSSSYVGSALAYGLRNEFEVVGTFYRHQVHIPGVFSYRINLMDGAEIVDVLKRFKPDVIIYAAGLTRPEDCKKQKQKCTVLNYQAPSVFLKAGFGKMFIYLSTHLVFAGNPRVVGEAPFDPDDPTDPTTDFATDKFKMENATLIYRSLGQVVRMGPVYGEAFHWYYHTSLDWGFGVPWHLGMLEQMQNSMPLKLANDQLISPVYIGDVVRGIKILIHSRPIDAKIHHFASGESVSFADVGRLTAQRFGFSPKLIQPFSIASQNPDFLGAVSLDTSLDPREFEQSFSFRFQNFTEGLNEFAHRREGGVVDAWL